MTSDERWLAAMWPFVRSQLPPPAARVLEIGCGPLGGFVPRLIGAGYDATGVDQEAPRGAGYVQADFERYQIPDPADAIVACLSLHHVADVGVVLERINAALAPGGVLVVVEWAWERFDERTARWCFDRLPESDADNSFLGRLRAHWRESGQPWHAWCRSRVEAEGLHEGDAVIGELTARFDTQSASYGPYFFAELDHTSEADEQAAIDAGQIQATRIDYVGRPAAAPD